MNKVFFITYVNKIWLFIILYLWNFVNDSNNIKRKKKWYNVFMLIFNKMAFCLFIWDSLTSINLYKRVEPIVYSDLLVLLYPNLTHCQGAEPAIPICIPDTSVANSYLILGFWWCKQKKEKGRYCLVDTYTHSYIYPYGGTTCPVGPV